MSLALCCTFGPLVVVTHALAQHALRLLWRANVITSDFKPSGHRLKGANNSSNIKSVAKLVIDPIVYSSLPSYRPVLSLSSPSVIAQLNHFRQTKLSVIQPTMSASSVSIQDNKLKSLGLQKMTVNREQIISYSRGLGSASEQNPVLVLIHGYPQSSYM